MNRPTIDVDELLELADEALAAGDTQEAVGILRRATNVAPLRKDIRNRLAMVLEGTPVVSRKTGRMSGVPVRNLVQEDDSFSLEENDFTSGREAISQIAKRAFEAASEKTTKATVATRKLTDMLQQGLSSWKTRSASELVVEEKTPIAAAPAMFEPEIDLQEYLNKTADNYAINIGTAEEDIDETSQRVIKRSPVSKKSSSSPNGKSKRPTDVEDVLAAGIGGFIEAAATADRRKISFGLVYFFMAVLFGYACFDVSRKFPGVPEDEGSSRNVIQASVGLSTGHPEMDDHQAFEKATMLASAGDFDAAIALLKNQLESGKVLSNRESIRIEIATVLNEKAESRLRKNQFAESVSAYTEALNFLPHDANLQVRLANALYYQAILGTGSQSEKLKKLESAEQALVPVTAADKSNLQAYRLLALVYEAADKSDKSQAIWKKVKALAPAESAMLAEAKSHLK